MKVLHLIILLTFWLPSAAFAQVVLSVIGGDGQVVKTYSMDDLDALDQTTYVTTNAYVDEPAEYSGPLLRALLEDAEQVSTPQSAVKLAAIDDYMVDIPMTDVLKYDVILATRRDAKTMSLREKGPIWIMYPISDHEELKDSLYSGRLVWQLKSVQVIN